MPRSAYFTKEEIIEKSLQIVRQEGAEALSARSLSKALNCSISPIFTIFKNMDEVAEATHAAAYQLFSDYVDDVMDYVPAFKEFGLRLVRFARDERNLFHYIFLGKNSVKVHPKAVECLELICQEYDLDKSVAELLYNQMWTFACGLSVLSLKESDRFPDSLVSEMISLQFTAMVAFLKSGRTFMSPEPRRRNDGEKATTDLDI